MSGKIKTTLKVIGILAIILIAIIVSKIMDWKIFSSEITSYPVLCKERVEYGYCKEPSVVLNPTTYKVSVENQEVVSWMKGMGGIQKLTKCAVRDRKNWTCKYDDESAEFGFNEGQYFNFTLKSSIPVKEFEKEYYVPPFIWAKIKCTENGSVSYPCALFTVLFE